VSAPEVDGRRAVLQTEVADADERLKRLYKMVEEGVTDLDDVLRERIASLKLGRDRARTALDRIRSQAASQTQFDPESVERFGRMMRENLTSGEVPFRKSYIRSVVDRIEVDDQVIRIIGDRATLEQAVADGAMASAGVRSRVPKWRPRTDSNQRPQSLQDCTLSRSGNTGIKKKEPGLTPPGRRIPGEFKPAFQIEQTTLVSCPRNQQSHSSRSNRFGGCLRLRRQRVQKSRRLHDANKIARDREQRLQARLASEESRFLESNVKIT